MGQVKSTEILLNVSRTSFEGIPSSIYSFFRTGRFVKTSELSDQFSNIGYDWQQTTWNLNQF